MKNAQAKKTLRKSKDKIIHCANDIRTVRDNGKVPEKQQELLDQARDLLIEATNRLVEAINYPHLSE